MKNKKSEIAMIVILTVISVLFIAPIIIVFMNSFKSKLYINSITVCTSLMLTPL